MGATLLADVQNQVQTVWSPLFMDELKEASLLPSLVNKKYQGDLNNKRASTVRVSQIDRPTATRKTVGDGHEYFNANKLVTQYVDITADQRISAAFKFDDLVELQSQIGDQNSKIRQALIEACDISINDYLYSLVSPSTSSPDHLINGVTDFNASQLNTAAKLASQAKWLKQDGWFCLADPSYASDLRSAQTLTSSDYVGPEGRVVVGGQFATNRFGFSILEDNSAGLISAMQRLGSSTGTEDAALLFHPDFLHLVMPQMAEFEVSSTHSNEQFGYIISVKFLIGAKLGIAGSKKHILVYNS